MNAAVIPKIARSSQFFGQLICACTCAFARVRVRVYASVSASEGPILVICRWASAERQAIQRVAPVQ